MLNMFFYSCLLLTTVTLIGAVSSSHETDPKDGRYYFDVPQVPPNIRKEWKVGEMDVANLVYLEVQNEITRIISDEIGMHENHEDTSYTYVLENEISANFSAQLINTLESKGEGEIEGIDWQQVSDYIIKLMTPILNKSIFDRNNILSDRMFKRVDTHLISLLKEIKVLLINEYTDGMEPEEIINIVIDQVPSNVRTILVYPVVKEEIRRAVKTSEQTSNSPTTVIANQLAPFVKEGLINKEREIMNQIPSESIVNELRNKIGAVLSKSVIKSVEFLKQLSDILPKEFDDNVMLRNIGKKLRIKIRPYVAHLLDMSTRSDIWLHSKHKPDFIDFVMVEVYLTEAQLDGQNNEHEFILDTMWKLLEKEIRERVDSQIDFLKIPVLENPFMRTIKNELTYIHCPEEIRLFLKQNATFTSETLEKLVQNVIDTLKLKDDPTTGLFSECVSGNVTTLIKQTLTQHVFENYHTSPDDFVNSKFYNIIMERLISLCRDIEKNNSLLSNLSSDLHGSEL